MNFPPTQIFNFFDQPEEVLGIAESMTYSKPYGSYPGKRTEELHVSQQHLFDYVGLKCMSVFYSKQELDTISWTASAQFQKITYEDVVDGRTAWVHKDASAHFTSIIYLTRDMIENGTSIFLPKQKGYQISQDLADIRDRFYMQGDLSNADEYKNAAHKHNSSYQRAAYFESMFNSCILFDGSYPHKAEFNIKEGETRLTLVTFFFDIRAVRFPLSGVRKVL